MTAPLHATKLLRQLVWQALDYDMLDSAEVNAERLLAENPQDEEARHLLGLALYRQGRYRAAAEVVNREGVRHIGCVYVYAQCCLKLKLYAQGIRAIERRRGQWQKSEGESVVASSAQRAGVPDAAAVSCLLGKLYQAMGDRMGAIKAHAVSARHSPYLWDSVAALCELGVNLRTENVFRQSDSAGTAGDSYDPFAAPAPVTRAKQHQQTGGPSAALSTASAAINTPVMKGAGSGGASAHDDGFSTPSDTREAKKPPPAALPLAPQKRPATRSGTFDIRPPPSFDSLLAAKQGTGTTTTTTTTAGPGSRRIGTAVTGGNRGMVATGGSGAHGHGHHVLAPASKTRTARAREETAARREGETYIVHMFRALTEAYKMFCAFQFQSALHWFSQLPEPQKDTPWVLGKLGRTYFEMVDYKTAERYFQRLRDAARCRTVDMEYYSTLLWHLRKDVELSFLSHELLEVDRGSWQAWCALGNSFSIQKDTDQALKCFQRAVQLAPDSPYAYTLQGHEHCENDAYEKAQEAFRLAIRANSRHYNAWYGLGMVFHRLGNLEMAEYHYQKAAAINPSNAVVICCVGGILEQGGRLTEALELYKKACDIQPKSASARFKKARILVDLKLYNAALVEFDHLRTLAPDEAKVHFLLGTLYKLLDNRELAVKHFTIALNLDPRGAHVIKETLEGLGDVPAP